MPFLRRYLHRCLHTENPWQNRDPLLLFNQVPHSYLNRNPLLILRLHPHRLFNPVLYSHQNPYPFPHLRQLLHQPLHQLPSLLLRLHLHQLPNRLLRLPQHQPPC